MPKHVHACCSGGLISLYNITVEMRYNMSRRCRQLCRLAASRLAVSHINQMSVTVSRPSPSSLLMGDEPAATVSRH